LRDLLTVLTERFSERTGIHPRLSFGASGNLSRQIAQGAPFELFLSANEGYVLDLARLGLLEDEGAVYALGRLALLVRRGSPLRADERLLDLRAALEDGRLERLAIPNPDHAPYGAAARRMLRNLGLWESARPRLVVGENVGQAAQFAATGNAQGGIVAYALAISPSLAECCEHAAISPRLHAPLRQRGALVRGAGEGAHRFFAFLLGAEGRELVARAGFDLPATDQ
jgi:molybdate transport system substrate-binding protein